LIKIYRNQDKHHAYYAFIVDENKLMIAETKKFWYKVIIDFEKINDKLAISYQAVTYASIYTEKSYPKDFTTRNFKEFKLNFD
jgi:hypothetical protein